MRERVDQLGVAEPEIQQSGRNQINVALPDVSNLNEAIKQVGTVAQLAFYDWEVNVIGPDGKPAPTDAAVTGGGGGGDASSPAALSLYDALLRAEKRPAKAEANNSRDGNLYYAVDRAAKKTYGLGEETRAAALANVPKAIARARPTVVVVKPDTVIVRAQNTASSAKLDKWFVLKDDVALEGKELKNPEQNFDQGAGGSGAPIVTFEFTDKGRKTWQSVTKQIAQRGSRERRHPAGSDGRSGQPALRDRARQRARLDAVHRLPPQPRRHRRAHRLADRGRLHDPVRAGARERPEDRRAAGPAGAHLELAGIRDAWPPGAQPGPRRGHRGLRHRRAVPAASSTACSA